MLKWAVRVPDTNSLPPGPHLLQLSTHPQGSQPFVIQQFSNLGYMISVFHKNVNGKQLFLSNSRHNLDDVKEQMVNTGRRRGRGGGQ